MAFSVKLIKDNEEKELPIEVIIEPQIKKILLIENICITLRQSHNKRKTLQEAKQFAIDSGYPDVLNWDTLLYS